MENNNFPFVSIIVPVYNGEKTIRECVESLLNQNYPKDRYEIIIVDNNSKDKTSEFIKKYPVKYVLEDKIQGSYASRNSGIDAANGDIIAFTDDDCICIGSWLSNISYVFTNFNADVVTGKVDLKIDFEEFNFFPVTFLKNRFAHIDYGKEIKKLENKDFVCANVAIKKTVFLEYGKFDSSFELCGDTAFSRKLSSKLVNIYYSPGMKVNHLIEKNRITIKYFYKQSFKWGQSKVKMNDFDRTNWKTFNWLLKKVIVCFLLNLRYLFHNKTNYFLNNCSIYANLGSMHEIYSILINRK